MAYVGKPKRRQPSKAAMARVRDSFDADMLADLCIRNDFTEYATKVDLPPSAGGRERFYWYQDNGSDILAVAHLDTVQDDRICSVVDTAAGLLAASGGLDDRLGVYVILDMLPKLGITCDWLLTTDEEIGQSTAVMFNTKKEYNWIIQFDRGGTDVVMYQYETDQLCEMVRACGAQVGQGSFSDICMLDFLGVAGFNWGVGYRDYHSARSHAWLEDTFRMVARFVKFHKANGSKVLSFDYLTAEDEYADGYWSEGTSTKNKLGWDDDPDDDDICEAGLDTYADPTDFDDDSAFDDETYWGIRDDDTEALKQWLEDHKQGWDKKK